MFYWILIYHIYNQLFYTLLLVKKLNVNTFKWNRYYNAGVL
jgi:hypothetical protein